jgi:hypothetical protein
MTTDEIHEKIQNCDHCGQGGTMQVIPILEHLTNKIAEMEKRLVDNETELFAIRSGMSRYNP